MRRLRDIVENQPRRELQKHLGRLLIGDEDRRLSLHIAEALEQSVRHGGAGIGGMLALLGPPSVQQRAIVSGLAASVFGSIDAMHMLDTSFYDPRHGGKELFDGIWCCYTASYIEVPGLLGRALKRTPSCLLWFTHLTPDHTLDGFAELFCHAMEDDVLVDIFAKPLWHTPQTLVVLSIDVEMSPDDTAHDVFQRVCELGLRPERRALWSERVVPIRTDRIP